MTERTRIFWPSKRHISFCSRAVPAAILNKRRLPFAGGERQITAVEYRAAVFSASACHDVHCVNAGLPYKHVVHDAGTCDYVVEYAISAGCDLLQLVPDSHIGIANEFHLPACEDRAAQSPGGKNRYQCQEAYLQP